jgi:hypothetical protein
MEDTAPGESGEQLLNKEHQQATTDDGEVEIVDHEESVQREGFAVLHQFSSPKDDNIVRDQRDDRLFES